MIPFHIWAWTEDLHGIHCTLLVGYVHKYLIRFSLTAATIAGIATAITCIIQFIFVIAFLRLGFLDDFHLDFAWSDGILQRLPGKWIQR